MMAVLWPFEWATTSWCLSSRNAFQMNVWAQPLVKLRLPHIFNLRRDPFERADFNSNTYWDWMVNHAP